MHTTRRQSKKKTLKKTPELAKLEAKGNTKAIGDVSKKGEADKSKKKQKEPLALCIENGETRPKHFKT